MRASRVSWAPIVFAALHTVACVQAPVHAEDVSADYLVLVPPTVSRVNAAGEFIPISVKESEDLLRRQREFYRKYHGQRVVIEGIFESSFEHLAIAGLWLQFVPGVAQQFYHSAAYQAAKRKVYNLPPNTFRFIAISVKCWGTLESANSGYGHLGQYPGQLMVDRIEALPVENSRQ